MFVPILGKTDTQTYILSALLPDNKTNLPSSLPPIQYLPNLLRAVLLGQGLDRINKEKSWDDGASWLVVRPAWFLLWREGVPE